MEAENCKGSSYVDEAVLPGFRFYPTDEELVGFYLHRKVEKKPLKIELIKQIDIYKYDPWDLPKVSNAGKDEGYFFCMRGRKYRNSIRPNRVTGSGFWKATGIDKPIYTSQEPPECIGLKKSLVYYLGSAGKGNKTDWMMHEFRLPPPTMKNSNNNKGNFFGAQSRNAAEEAEVWTLCRIFKRTPSYRRYAPETKNNITSLKKSPVDSSSKACSWESEYGERCLSFGDSFKKNNDRKPSLIGVNHSQSHNVDNVHHQAAAATTTYPAIWNFNNGEDVLSNGNWDELTSFFHGASGS